MQVVSLLERLSPQAVRVGGDGPPALEALRFRHDPSMAFSASDLTGAVLRRSDSQEPRVDLVCTFLGLVGAAGPLPLHLCAEVAQEEVSGGNRRRFLDVFHHRLLSLFYRLWSRYELAQEARSDCRDAWSARALCLAGQDVSGTKAEPTALADRLALLPLTLGLARTAHGLRLGLRRILPSTEAGFDVGVEQWAGGYVTLEPSSRMRLGRPTAVLGATSVLGARVFDPSAGIRLHIGPIAPADSSAYLPGGARYRAIEALVTSFVRQPLDYELRLSLGGGPRRGFKLSARADEPLGRSSFLASSGRAQTLTVRCAARATL